MKEELKRSGYRHGQRLIQKITEVVDIPSVIKDAILKEMEYATLDGYRITMKNNRNGEVDDNSEVPEKGNEIYRD